MKGVTEFTVCTTGVGYDAMWDRMSREGAIGENRCGPATKGFRDEISSVDSGSWKCGKQASRTDVTTFLGDIGDSNVVTINKPGGRQQCLKADDSSC